MNRTEKLLLAIFHIVIEGDCEEASKTVCWRVVRKIQRLYMEHRPQFDKMDDNEVVHQIMVMIGHKTQDKQLQAA